MLTLFNLTQLKNYSIFLFIFTCALFSPTKELVLGGVSLPEVFFVILLLLSSLSILKNIVFGKGFVIISMVSIVMTIISYIYNITPVSEIKHLLRIIEYYLIFSTFYSITTIKSIGYFKNAFLWSGLIVSLYTYVQFFFPVVFIFQNWGPSKTIDFDYSNVIYQRRMISFLDNPLNLTSYFALLLGFIHFAVNSKLVKILFLVIVYIAGMLSVSRSFILCVVISMGIILYQGRKEKLTLVFLTLVLITLLFCLPKFDIDFSNFSRFFDKDNTDETTSQRFYVISSSIEMIRDYFLLGVGPGNFPYYYNEYRQMMASVDPTLSTAENVFLQFILDYGLLPFLSYVYIIYRFYSNSFRLRKRNAFYLSSILSVTLYLMTGFSHSLGGAANNFIFFSILGTCLRLREISSI